ncbi:hypothetical protein [Embleya sp. NPDC001921]
MAASPRTLPGRVIPAGRGPRTPARVHHGTHVITTARPPHPRVLAELDYVADDANWGPDDELYADRGSWAARLIGDAS